MRAGQTVWPALPLGQWQDTYATLHMWLQIVGKTRLALAPMQNHWWQVALYVTPRGLTTSAIPVDQRCFAVELDFIAHELRIVTSWGDTRVLPLHAQSVADFYRDYMAALHALGVEVALMAVPVEITTAIPFARDREHAAYDPDAAHRCWQVLVHADRVLKRFAGCFRGKASPVHFFWGSFDLAYTRFSGRRAPRHNGGAPNCPDYVMVEAYSHECSSFGFWPGSGAVAEPAFYAYSYPEPAGYANAPVGPDGAYYHAELREFVFPYDAVRSSAQPDAALLAFLQGTYDAAADLGGWDRAALDRPGEACSPIAD
jgi:hypothetical protein